MTDKKQPDAPSLAIAKILAKALRKQYPYLKVTRRGDVVTTTFPASVTPIQETLHLACDHGIEPASFAETLATAMGELGVSRYELAERFAVSQSAIERWIAGSTVPSKSVRDDVYLWLYVTPTPSTSQRRG